MWTSICVSVSLQKYVVAWNSQNKEKSSILRRPLKIKFIPAGIYLLQAWKLNIRTYKLENNANIYWADVTQSVGKLGTLEQDTEFQNAHITFTHMQLELAPAPSPCSQTEYSSYKLENTATLNSV